MNYSYISIIVSLFTIIISLFSIFMSLKVIKNNKLSYETTNSTMIVVFLLALAFSSRILAQETWPQQRLENALLYAAKYTKDMDSDEKNNLIRYIELTIARLETASDTSKNIAISHKLSNSINCMYVLSRNRLKGLDTLNRLKTISNMQLDLYHHLINTNESLALDKKADSNAFGQIFDGECRKHEK